MEASPRFYATTILVRGNGLGFFPIVSHVQHPGFCSQANDVRCVVFLGKGICFEFWKVLVCSFITLNELQQGAAA